MKSLFAVFLCLAFAFKARPQKGYAVSEIRDGLYWITDGAYNTMFLVTNDSVIVIDPLPALGAKYLQGIREVTNKPVKYLIYSHEHTDHIGGANLFAPGIQIIAQKRTAELLAMRHDPRRPLPNVSFDTHYTLNAGGQRLELTYPGPNHEDGNIFIYAPRQKTLMFVDVIYPGYMPYKNLGIVQDVPGYRQSHRDALKYSFDTLVGGHVGRLGTRRDVEVSLEFAQDLQAVAAAQLKNLPFPAFLATHSGPDKWDLHNEYEKILTEKCSAELCPRWSKRLMDTHTYLKDNCWAMIEAIVVQTPP
jgi:glyoxylase-like metal-dependent hydrolase (beta-lactamase superfamily II)